MNAVTKAENVREIVPVSNNRPDPLQMLGAAIERGMSVSDLGPLMDLVERDQANKARVSFMSAMAEFQANCPTIKKSSKGHNSNFAGLDEIFVTIRPHLAASGLAVRFDSETGDGKQTAICYVSHRDGHVEQSRFTCPIDSKMAANDSQKAGSANSYARRYALNNALNLVGSNFDDDGESAGAAFIDDKTVKRLIKELDDLNVDKIRFCKFMSIDSIAEMPESKLAIAENFINAKRKPADESK